jgi:hypothetical protein
MESIVGARECIRPILILARIFNSDAMTNDFGVF